MDIQRTTLPCTHVSISRVENQCLRMGAALLSNLTKTYLCSLVTAVHTLGRTPSLADRNIPARYIHTYIRMYIVEERIQGKEIAQVMDDSLYMFVCYTNLCMYVCTYSAMP